MYYALKRTRNQASLKNSRCNSCVRREQNKLRGDKIETRFTREYLRDEYVIRGKSIKEIVISNNTNYQKISSLLHKYGIKVRNKLEIAFNKAEGFIGRRFDMLVVIGRKENDRNRGTMWECRCDCGKSVVYTSHHLKSGDCKSCGCKRKTQYEEIPGSYFNTLKTNASARSLEYAVTPEFLWNLYLKQNKRCALSGVEIKFGNQYKKIPFTASLDRIDSSKGYIESNVQWVHKLVNQIKWDLSQEEFLRWIDIIHTFQHPPIHNSVPTSVIAYSTGLPIPRGNVSFPSCSEV